MKTYTATLTGLRGKDVLNLIDTMPNHVGWDINLDPEEEPEPEPVARANGSTILSMTGKKAQYNSIREKVLTIFEKLEVKHGIGNVSRKMLRQEIVKKKINPQNISQLINGGYLKTLD